MARRRSIVRLARAALVATTMVAAALAACRREPPPRVSCAGDPVGERARAVLVTHCGECHVGGRPTALPRALAVYDLAAVDWSHSMSAVQLRDAVDRLRAPLAPTRGSDEARPLAVSDEERRSLQAFVDAELARRAR
jgi:hypothetical protein